MSLSKAPQALLMALGSLCVVASMSGVANAEMADAPISQPTIPEAVDQVTGNNKYWAETSIQADTKWLLGIEFDDARIQNRAERFEALYLDLMRQNDEDLPTMRTADLPNPFDSTVSDMFGEGQL